MLLYLKAKAIKTLYIVASFLLVIPSMNAQVYNAKDTDTTITNSIINDLYLGECSNVTISNCKGITTIFGINDNVTNIVPKNVGIQLFIGFNHLQSK